MTSRRMIIAPSLLSADFARLGEDCLRAEAAGADWHHVDVMDGHFVPNITIGPTVVRALAKVLTLPLDVHLMITDPWTYGPQFLDAGAAGIGFHAELLLGDGAREARQAAERLIAEIHARDRRATMVVNPATPLDPILPFLPDLDMVLVMSVVPGFGGQAFMPEVLEKVRALRDLHGFGGDVQMDGGISRETIAACAEAGCNVFVAGSALYGASDMKAEIAVFRERIESAVAG